jgi:hypothetical protein
MCGGGEGEGGGGEGEGGGGSGDGGEGEGGGGEGMGEGDGGEGEGGGGEGLGEGARGKGGEKGDGGNAGGGTEGAGGAGGGTEGTGEGGGAIGGGTEGGGSIGLGDIGGGACGGGTEGGGGLGTGGKGGGSKGGGGGGNGGGGDGAITVTRIGCAKRVSTVTLPAVTTTLSWASPSTFLLSAAFRALAGAGLAMAFAAVHTAPVQEAPPAPSVTIRVAVINVLYGLGSHVVYVARGGSGDGGGGVGGGGAGKGASLTTEMTAAPTLRTSPATNATPSELSKSSLFAIRLLIVVLTLAAPLSVHTIHSWHTILAGSFWDGSMWDLQLAWLEERPSS